MKKHIYFNLSDKPDNMGISQVTDDLNGFIDERKDILKDAKLNGNKLVFTKPDGTEGFAIVNDVPDDFQN